MTVRPFFQACEQPPIRDLVADLDGLKKINDTWGHQIGDAYIQSFGRALHDSFRKGDIVGRLGGD